MYANALILPFMTIDDVRAMLRKSCDQAGTLRAWAKVHGLSPAYVSDVVRGNRAPGPSILKALGLHTDMVYRKTKGE